MFFSENSRLQAETHLDPGVSVKAAQNAMNLAAAKSSDRSDRAPKLPPAQWEAAEVSESGTKKPWLSRSQRQCAEMCWVSLAGRCCCFTSKSSYGEMESKTSRTGKLLYPIVHFCSFLRYQVRSRGNCWTKSQNIRPSSTIPQENGGKCQDLPSSETKKSPPQAEESTPLPFRSFRSLFPKRFLRLVLFFIYCNAVWHDRLGVASSRWSRLSIKGPLHRWWLHTGWKHQKKSSLLQVCAYSNGIPAKKKNRYPKVTGNQRCDNRHLHGFEVQLERLPTSGGFESAKKQPLGLLWG